MQRKEAARWFGVEEQTISNWIKSGILTGRKIGSLVFVDKETVTCHSDTLQEIKQTEERLQRKLQEAKEREESLDKHIEDIAKAETSVPTAMPQWMVKELFRAIINTAGYDVLTSPEWQVLSDINDGLSISQTCDKNWISREVAMKRIRSAFRKIQAMKSFSEVRKECKELQKNNQILENMVEFLNKELKVARDTIEAKREAIELSYQNLPPIYQGEDGIARLREVLTWKIFDTTLSTRIINALLPEIRTIGDIVIHEKRFFEGYRNLGKKSINDLEEFLELQDLSFGMDIELISRALKYKPTEKPTA
ncbi:MAG: hypothetical protein IKN08_01140 [Bacteroidales bacterium]|nr:hypothetical protein [Bacteroidales bacterium]